MPSIAHSSLLTSLIAFLVIFTFNTVQHQSYTFLCDGEVAELCGSSYHTSAVSLTFWERIRKIGFNLYPFSRRAPVLNLKVHDYLYGQRTDQFLSFYISFSLYSYIHTHRYIAWFYKQPNVLFKKAKPTKFI